MATVDFKWSSDSLGNVEISSQDLGSVSTGGSTTATTVYFGFTSDTTGTSVSDVKIYARVPLNPPSGAPGSEELYDQFETLKQWGDSTNATTFGGLKLAYGTVGTDLSGLDQGHKTISDGQDTRAFVVTTATGSNLNNAVLLPQSLVSGSSSAGSLTEDTFIPLQIQVDIPSSNTNTGDYYVELQVSYTYTS